VHTQCAALRYKKHPAKDFSAAVKNKSLSYSAIATFFVKNILPSCGSCLVKENMAAIAFDVILTTGAMLTLGTNATLNLSSDNP
jgi:hypothetical protein